MQRYIILFFLLLFFSCTTIRKSSSSIFAAPKTLAINKFGEGDNKIAFLTLEVTLKDTAKDIYDFKLVKTVFANGTLSNNSVDEPIVFEPGYFYCAISADDKTTSDYIKVKNPLKMAYEYADEGGQLKQAVILKNKAEVFIRFQYNKNLKYISIYNLPNNSLLLKKIFYATL